MSLFRLEGGFKDKNFEEMQKNWGNNKKIEEITGTCKFYVKAKPCVKCWFYYDNRVVIIYVYVRTGVTLSCKNYLSFIK